ncbi:MAG TPA: F0F1 ATP synthase subunit A [Terriglobales bacterium]|nr:F0F1 ATP synthase subunit A [Terriglobales bacterium]
MNLALARPVDVLLGWLGVAPAHPQAPISNTFSMEILVALILMGFATWLRGRLSVENPKAWQQIVELSWNGIGEHSEEVIGHGGSRFLNYLFTLTFFILISNLIGLIPGFESPTADISVTVGLALMAFLYYHTFGIRKHGLLRYLKTFLGPFWWLAWLMLPIEIISHFARILSLSVRLFANMFAGELITTIFLALLPVAGVIFMGLHVFVAILQAYIFLVLTMVYLAGALADEH